MTVRDILQQHFLRRDIRTTQDWRDIVISISHGLKVVHQSGFLHNDIKTNNVVIVKDRAHSFRGILIEFGLSCALKEGKTDPAR